MRRIFVLALAVIALVGMLAPGAYAQAPAAPAPTFSITGLVDNLTSASHNLRDSNFARVGDKEWYARSRGLFFINSQIGQARAVLGLEIDSAWGQVSATDNALAGQVVANNQQRAGTTSGFDLGTDTLTSLEVKHLYTEFPVPLMPFPTIMRLGAQPVAATYKLSTLFSGDAAAAHVTTTWSPNVKSNFTYVAVEEELTGPSTGGTGLTGFNRGDDYALIFSLDVTPMKGLDIRPIYSVFFAQGATSGGARQLPSGIGGAIAFARKPIGACAAGAATCGLVAATPGAPTHEEWRHTIGVDARWTSGPWSFAPTFFYQFGTREIDNPFVDVGQPNAIRESDISAWLVDVIGGYRMGPWFFQGRYMYTSGNRPKDQLSQDTNYYQPIMADSGYWAAGWGNIYSLGIDYFNGAIKGLGGNIGLDRYGRQQFAVSADYNWTPALNNYLVVSPAWTARSIDTDGVNTAAGAIACATHSANSADRPRGAGCDGDESYLGTEVNLGMTWRFAPGLTMDVVGAYLFAGGAMDTTERRNDVDVRRGAEDVYTGVVRVRYSF